MKLITQPGLMLLRAKQARGPAFTWKQSLFLAVTAGIGLGGILIAWFA